MKILMLSTGPIAQEWVSGGATKILRDLAFGLAERGNEIRLVCGARTSNSSCRLKRGVELYPTLRFNPIFPEAYAVPPHRHLQLMSEGLQHSRWADIVYIHDGGYLYADLFREKPLVISARELMYTESLLGVHLFRRDRLVVNSNYSAHCVLDTLGHLFPEVGSRLSIIENGFAFSRFLRHPTEEAIKTALNLPSSNRPLLLFPHRPDARKGLSEALKVLRLLKRTYVKNPPLLLVPGSSPDGRPLSVPVTQDLEGDVLFHPWLSHKLMPAYYRLGIATLCIGDFVEGFASNVVLESLASGTPVIQAKVGPARDMPPTALLHQVEPQDTEATAAIIQGLLESRKATAFNTDTAYLKQYSLDKMVNEYETLFHIAAITPPLQAADVSTSRATYKLAAWCAWMSQGLYHDFAGTYWQGEGHRWLREATLENAHLEESTWKGQKIPDCEWQYLLSEGFLVPCAATPIFLDTNLGLNRV